ncbi:phosphatases II [Suhomyces tanzawaensis NRRL Y-17324]|uniref:Phosphatases II n=1 Tax=Suhomyces tanzawaensis NRRL Y-17324 TaxID=984487 RepID=A0A1E4SI54_9ASCO|nr:phosphatases II [Suhomyces tanzawaensis NRRL Y-17324]ODV79181.1 phosphatases II [Suhomyces tanzawaensis NRRL Y-17324]
MEGLSTVNNVVLNRRGYTIQGTLILSPYHVVFSFTPPSTPSSSTPSPGPTPVAPKEIWICYPVVEAISKSRGSFLLNQSNNEVSIDDSRDHYTSSHIRLQCKDFTFYSFDFVNDGICTEVYSKLSTLISRPKLENDIKAFYAFDYRPNLLEQKLETKGWDLYDPVKEYERQGLVSGEYWRISTINEDYKFCPSYPNHLVVPSSISDNVLKHASKFRSKQRIPAIVYRHRGSVNGNIIARCAQPLVGLNIQNRSIQDEKLITEIFKSQESERFSKLDESNEFQHQPHRNLIVDLRPITNAMAQHALGAGTENIENYRGKRTQGSNEKPPKNVNVNFQEHQNLRQVDKIFCNIDNIHVMRDSLNKLTTILNDLDKFPVNSGTSNYPLLQQALTKTQWLHRLSIILQSVDRITKSIHLNNTNVVIHCSDGWDRTSQVSALAQLCLDPFYRTLKGFMILIEKEWVSFGFKFSTRGDHGGCIGALYKKPKKAQEREFTDTSSESSEIELPVNSHTGKVTSFLQRAATHIKNTANGASNNNSSLNLEGEVGENGGKFLSSNSSYNGSNEKSPIFHQFLDSVFQIYRQNPTKFEFNSRFLKRLFYHYYSCQYGSFLCDSERELKEVYKVQESTLSVWDYFNSRPGEFINPSFKVDDGDDNGVLFFNYTDVKWWFELYGRSDEEMNGLSNSLDRKFAQMKLTITDPFILYQSYIQQGLLEKDEAQLRAMKEFQKLYHRIIDYRPPEELQIKMSLLLREIELKQAQMMLDSGKSGSPMKLGSIQRYFRKDPEAQKKQLIKVITDEEELINFPSPPGLLVNGEVGCGKSMLMDIFASSLPHHSKMRWHYNNFILWVFNEIHKIQGQKTMMANLGQKKSLSMENEFILFEIAQKMIKKNTVLMLDEFMLPDIASANIIKILFTYYFKLGGVLVATSNKLPEELYSNEFHKSKFKSFVGVLNARCQSIDMMSNKDYRITVSEQEPNLVVKMDPEHENNWDILIRTKALKISPEQYEKPLHELGSPASFTVYNRVTQLLLTFFDNTCYLDFAQICQGLYSSSDYITLASRYRTIILDNVPIMTIKMKNEARRFITLLDAIYESKCQLYMRTEVDIDDLFFPDTRDDISDEIRSRLPRDFSDTLDVQEEEMFSKTSIALQNPYRPNTSTYEDKMETFEEEQRKTEVDFKNTKAFTGEDEKFAYKRAVSRIKEMVSSDNWRSEDRWVPIDESMRPWESHEEFAQKVTSEVLEAEADDKPIIQGLHHFWAMGPWTTNQGKRLKDSIAKSWIRSSIRDN